tara:strand:+ start:1147 stop:2160 length:1014 start_codon:yes stop_codon:yes gene_type:complete
MSIQFSHSPTETKIDKVIKKLPYQQTKQQFVQTAIEHYIENLVMKNNFTPIVGNRLEIVLEFLREGFCWPNKRVIQVKEYILQSNSSIGFYGFVMYDDNNCICSAILTPFQGVFENNKIISLMSWYSKPSQRGLQAIIFAQNFKKFLLANKFIITNYTPSPSVLLILKSLEFKTMNGFRRVEFIFMYPFSIFNYLISKRKTKIINIKKIEYSPDLFKVSFQGDAKFFVLETESAKSSFCALKKILYKKIIGFNFPIPTLHIIWSQDQKHLISNWDVLCDLLFGKFKLLVIMADFSSDLSESFHSSSRNRSLKYLVCSLNNVLQFVPPLGSEICLSNK